MTVWIARLAFLVLRFPLLLFFFLFFFRRFRETNFTVHAMFMYCLRAIHGTHSHFIKKKNILKMGPTVLFTHLKIILLQFF